MHMLLPVFEVEFQGLWCFGFFFTFAVRSGQEVTPGEQLLCILGEKLTICLSFFTSFFS